MARDTKKQKIDHDLVAAMVAGGLWVCEDESSGDSMVPAPAAETERTFAPRKRTVAAEMEPAAQQNATCDVETKREIEDIDFHLPGWEVMNVTSFFHESWVFKTTWHILQKILSIVLPSKIAHAIVKLRNWTPSDQIWNPVGTHIEVTRPEEEEFLKGYCQANPLQHQTCPASLPLESVSWTEATYQQLSHLFTTCGRVMIFAGLVTVVVFVIWNHKKIRQTIWNILANLRILQARVTGAISIWLTTVYTYVASVAANDKTGADKAKCKLNATTTAAFGTVNNSEEFEAIQKNIKALMKYYDALNENEAMTDDENTLKEGLQEQATTAFDITSRIEIASENNFDNAKKQHPEAFALFAQAIYRQTMTLKDNHRQKFESGKHAALFQALEDRIVNIATKFDSEVKTRTWENVDIPLKADIETTLTNIEKNYDSQ